MPSLQSGGSISLAAYRYAGEQLAPRATGLLAITAYARRHWHGRRLALTMLNSKFALKYLFSDDARRRKVFIYWLTAREAARCRHSFTGEESRAHATSAASRR